MLVPQSYELFAVDLSALNVNETQTERSALVSIAQAAARRIVAWFIDDKDPLLTPIPVCVGVGVVHTAVVGAELIDLGTRAADEKWGKRPPREPKADRQQRADRASDA
jgi:hypothetical protein